MTYTLEQKGHTGAGDYNANVFDFNQSTRSVILKSGTSGDNSIITAGEKSIEIDFELSVKTSNDTIYVTTLTVDL